MGRRHKKGLPINGILLLDKPIGYTSNKALQAVKKILNAQKAGHTGSLDPLATGMLPLCFGEATKVSGFLLDSDKQYITDAHLGVKTSTGDRESEVILTRSVPDITVDDLEDYLQSFRGDITQIPPMHSALKKDGQPLYKLARDGVEIERPPRHVTILENSIINFDLPVVRLRIRCTKGTYIRSLIEDIGELLGCGATLDMLRREYVEPFKGHKLWTLEELQELSQSDVDGLLATLIKPEEALKNLPLLTLTQDEKDYFMVGKVITAAFDIPTEVSVRTFGPEGEFLGLSEYSPAHELRVKRLFNA